MQNKRMKLAIACGLLLTITTAVMASREYHERHDDDDHYERHERYERHDDDDRYERHERYERHDDDDRYERHERYERHDDDDRYERKRRNRRSQNTNIIINPKVTADQTRQIVANAMPGLKAGPAWVKQKRGRVEVVVPLLLNERIVGKVELDPTSGNIAPKEQRFTAQKLGFALEDAPKRVQKALRDFKVGSNIRLSKKGYWKVPLVLDNVEVGRVQVDSYYPTIMPRHKYEKAAYRYTNHTK